MKKNKWRIILNIEDLPELKERIQFLSGRTGKVSVGIDGIIDSKDTVDGREVLHDIPSSWVKDLFKAYIKGKKHSIDLKLSNQKKEMEHLNYIENILKQSTKGE